MLKKNGQRYLKYLTVKLKLKKELATISEIPDGERLRKIAVLRYLIHICCSVTKMQKKNHDNLLPSCSLKT